MFSRYFTASYFPDGWGAVGDLPEGSISGGTTFQVTAAATWSALASIEGAAAFQVTAEGTASTSEAGGSAGFSITATATLTYTGEPEQPAASGGGRFFRSYDRREVELGWLQGRATFRVAALGRITGLVVEEQVRPAVQILPAFERPFYPDELPFPQPVGRRAAQAVVPMVVKVEAPRPPVPADLAGGAQVTVLAAGTLSAVVLPPPVEPDDDSDTIAILLALLEAA